VESQHIDLFPKHLRQLPRLVALINNGLMTDPCIQVKLQPLNAQEGTSLKYCKQRLAKIISAGPTVFKIGYTGDPCHRWHRSPGPTSAGGYKYDRDHYHRMCVIYAAENHREAGLMEAHLIDLHLGSQGCKNIRLGGDGPVYSGAKRLGPFFTYVVYRHLVVLP
jgi:hypothetical protein